MRAWGWILAGMVALAAAPSLAGPLNISLRDDLDLMANTTGGLRTGGAAMNKLLMSMGAEDLAGVHGLTGYAEVFRTDGGEALSGRLLGDAQTASNIEAPAGTRLSQAWLEQGFGEHAFLKLGIVDLNADFDAIAPAGLMINSSHGVGAELAATGMNGPSIFPAEGLAAELRLEPSPSVTLRLAAFEGAPAPPGVFASVSPDSHDGALVIGQALWRRGEDLEAALGLWSYTAATPLIEDPARERRQSGVYGFVHGPLAPNWNGWVRLGLAEPSVSTIAGYAGAGVVRSAPFGRADDSLGLAIAHAVISGPARRTGPLPDAETAVELTYRFQANGQLALQPDIQWIRHPASQAGLGDALMVGVRVTFTASRDIPAH